MYRSNFFRKNSQIDVYFLYLGDIVLTYATAVLDASGSIPGSD